MFKTFEMNDGNNIDDEVKDILRKKEKWICTTRLSLWTYKSNFIHAAIFFTICVMLLFVVDSSLIMKLAGDGVSGPSPEQRYHYIALFAYHWNDWWMHIIKILPLWLSWSFIKRALFDYIIFRLVLTDKRVIVISGVVAKDYVDLPLEKIETIRVLQDLNGKVFKYGDIIINGVGDTTISAGGISEPLLFKKQIDHYQHLIEEEAE